MVKRVTSSTRDSSTLESILARRAAMRGSPPATSYQVSTGTQRPATTSASRAQALYNSNLSAISQGASTSSPYGSTSAYGVRSEGAASFASPYSEVFRTMPVGQSGYGTVTYEYNVYDKVPRSTAETLFRFLPPSQQAVFAAAAESVGRNAEPLYRDYVAMSGYLTTKGMNMSPYEILMQHIAEGSIATDPDSSTSGYGSYGGGGGGYSTTKTIDITTPTGARALLTQAMQGALGRDPSEDEIATFTKSLNESQQANPQIVTASGDTVTRTGGFEADVFAAEFVQNQDEFQEVQATQYYRGLIDALTGGGI